MDKCERLAKKLTMAVARLFCLSLVFSVAIAQAGPPRSIKGLFSGQPSFIGTHFPAEAFETMKVYKINPGFIDIAWTNWEWLRDHNFEVPAEGMTPQFKREVLDEVGWGIPGSNDPPDMY